MNARSPVVRVYLCPSCAGYEPVTDEDYRGALSGICQGCGGYFREVHSFPAFFHSAGGCHCRAAHSRVTGDVRLPS